MLEHLGWEILEQRHNQLTLLMLYKIIHQLVEVPHQRILTNASCLHQKRYQQEYILTNSPSSQGLSDFGILSQIM